MKRQTKHSGNSYWNNLIYRNKESNLPAINTINLAMGDNLNAAIEGDIINRGVSNLLSYGFVYAKHPNPTLADNVVVFGGTENFRGSYNEEVASLDSSSVYYFAAFATNYNGTSYGEVLTGETILTLVYDTFTDGNATPLDEHTPDVDLVGGGWSQVSTFEIVISSNRAAPSGSLGICTIDSGVADVRISAVFTPDGIVFTNTCGIVVRFQDSGNYWVVGARDTGSGNLIWVILEIIASKATLRVSGSSFTEGNSYEIEVICSGTTITLNVGGEQEITYNSAVNFQTETTHGINLLNSSLIDEFKILA